LPLGHTFSYRFTRQDVPKLSIFVGDHEKQQDRLRIAFYRDCSRLSRSTSNVLMVVIASPI
jgi:hypothetical protein